MFSPLSKSIVDKWARFFLYPMTQIGKRFGQKSSHARNVPSFSQFTTKQWLPIHGVSMLPFTWTPSTLTC